MFEGITQQSGLNQFCSVGWGMVWEGKINHLIIFLKTRRVNPPLADFWSNSCVLESNWKSLKCRKRHILFELCLWGKFLFPLEFPLNNGRSLALWLFSQYPFFNTLKGSTWRSNASLHLRSLSSLPSIMMVTAKAVMSLKFYYSMLLVSYDAVPYTTATFTNYSMHLHICYSTLYFL